MPHFPRRAPARWSLAALAAVLVAVVVVAGAVPTPATAKTVPIRVMTYNLRFAAATPPHSWSERLPLLLRVLRGEDPDVFGVQEAYWPMMRDLQAALPQYAWAGMGVLGGTQGEFAAIYYKRDRFDVLDFDHFWLSGTPSVIGSRTWGNAYVRMVTWVKLRDRKTGAVFYQLNTHLDNISGYSRTHAAQLVLQRIRGFQAGVPVLMTGDFNSPAGGTRTYSIMTGKNGFADTWTTAASRGAAVGTLNDWEPPRTNGDRIDWILSRGPVRTLSTHVDTYTHDGTFPSDHFPVIADLVINPPSARR
jgi:endonuclease/exonuclease/phosphatase family metal-dependent hydrolase